MLPYIGGKSTISKSLIVPNIPNDIEVYMEIFGGMMWVFFNMDIDKYPNLNKIIYNDFNPLNVNLFRCVKNHKKLLEACESIPVQQKGIYPTPKNCEDFFNSAQKELYDPNFLLGDDPNYDAAAKHALILASVFSGANPEKSKFIDLKGKYHSKFTSFMNKLNNPKWQKMFENIKFFENLDFEKAIEKYDSKTTYIYADPPYFKVGEGSYYSNHNFNRNDHLRLANCLKSMSGKFSLSYYDFPQLSEWFPKDDYVWKSKSFAKAAAAKAGKEQTQGIELLIMNYGKDKDLA